MNRLIIIPLALMILFALFSSVLNFTDVLTEDEIAFEDYQARLNSTKTGDNTEEYMIELPFDDSGTSFSFFSPQGFLLLLIGVVAIGIASSITILGSGLSPHGQSLIFQFGIYFAIWGILSAVSYSLLSNMDTYGGILWTILTLSYTIGFTNEMSFGGGSGE